MRKITLIALASLCGAAGYAQDTYDAVNFATSDLNGTARYVGMGGALGALGGDVSVMGTNPAGTAIFRKSDVSVSAGLVIGDKGVLGHDGTRASFDNAGIVIATEAASGALRGVNFGVNFTKKKNFLGNYDLGINNIDGTISQTYQIADLANECLETGNWGALANMAAPSKHHEGIINMAAKGNYYGVGAQKAIYQRSTYGGINQTDLNVSFNISDQFFIGLGLGVYDIDYNRETFYQELGIDKEPFYYDFTNWYKTSGTGVDVKLGMICRPIEDSPFRIGVAVHTPTWYNMEDVNGSSMYINDKFQTDCVIDPYEYNYRTPWKFGVSLGHTIGNYLAIGAEYEFADLSTAKYSQDGWGGETDHFRSVNRFTQDYLKMQHTMKFGLECKPIDNFSLRVGYNFVSQPIKDDAYRLIAADSPFTETDYINWKATNRVTFGLGYRFKGGYFDAAYQFSTQKGDLYAFYANDFKATEITNNRSQLICTFGLKF